jgi:ABC-type microcin C transport system permease subunit YejB
MPLNRRKALMIASLGFALVANFALVPSSQAGPIADMLARRKMNQQMKIPPMDKPFSTRPIADPNLKTAGLRERFKKRFSLGRGTTPQGVMPLNKDYGIVNTSR